MPYLTSSKASSIVERMASNFIKVPSTEAEWLNISKRFEEKWNFPHALGAIDGKHVRIQNPKYGGSFENLFRVLANTWRIFFTIINLEPKYVEDVIFTTLILPNMLIKSANFVNVYRPSSFADTILDTIHFIHYRFHKRATTHLYMQNQ